MSWGASDWTVPPLSVECPACASAAPMQLTSVPYFRATQARKNGEKPMLELHPFRAGECRKKGMSPGIRPLICGSVSHLWES